MKLELVAVPVTDVDRAKEFYEQVGFNADHDHTVSDEIRFVQMTPPGSACSIAFGKGLTEMAPGSLDNLQCVVADADATHAELPVAASRSAMSTSSPGAGSSTSATPTATAGRFRSSRTGRPVRAGPERTRMPEPRTYPEGVTSWVDVEVPDLAVAESFYGGLFGWSVEQVGPGYAIAKLDGQDVAGIANGRATPAWNTYVAVDDADDAAARVRAHGGQVLAGPDAGRGRPIRRLRRPGRRAVPALAGRPAPRCPDGQRAGSLELQRPARRRPGAAAAFYGSVFGWAVDDLGFATMIRRPGYGDHLAATIDPGIHERQAGVVRASRLRGRDRLARAGPAGRAAPLARVVHGRRPGRDRRRRRAARGTVLRRTDTGWTREALVRDPQGASFTASQFTPPD